jgi:hypothetical protein
MAPQTSPHPISEFRVEKSKVEATLTLSSGVTVSGYFFVSSNSRTHDGPECVGDVLNGESGFFPFQLKGLRAGSTVLYNRDHVIAVELADRNEVRRDPGYAVATERIVTMFLANGTRLRGAVRVFRPRGHDRLSDFARGHETFRYLEAKNATYLVNIRHVLELTEETPLS